MGSESRRRRPAQLEEMLKRAAAASFEAPNRAMKRRIRQRLHKKLGLLMSGDDFDKAIERFHLMEVAKQGQVEESASSSSEMSWPVCAVQDVRQLNEKDSSVRTPKTPKTASNSRSSDLRYWWKGWKRLAHLRLILKR
eukprot:symbB.v1.2.033591.t1/scaffold4198.1/size43174/4